MKIIHSDFTIVGGGVAGVCAAITAARHGLKVALIEARDVLGGNTSSEYRVHFNGAGAANYSFYAREAGVSDELKLTIVHQNPRYNFKDDYHLSDMAIYQKVIDEPNISLFLGTAVHSAKCVDERIEEIYARKTRTEEDYTFVSPLFADASGDGVLASMAGAEYRHGREGKAEFGEGLAPDQADGYTMGSCILFTVGKADVPVPYVKPPFAYDYVKDDILRFCERPETGRSLPRTLDGVTGIWWLSVGGTMDTVKDDDKIDLELKKLVYGFWDYVKNSGAYEGVDNYYLKWVAPHLARRESRRFIGDHILTQNDIATQEPFYDSVSTGGWPLDIHDPEGVYGNDLTTKNGKIHGLYNIPYRIMYSKNVENLFLLGRIISATHVALGSLRVMQTLGSMAAAAGTAAVLCKKYAERPRDISSPARVREMQTMLQRDGQYISGLAEDVGLAEGAVVSASACSAFENLDCDTLTPLDRTYVLALPVSEKRLDRVEVGVKNECQLEKALKIRLYSSYKNDCYEIKDLIEELCVPVPAGYDGFIPIEPRAASFPNHIALIALEPADGLSIYTSKQHFTGAPTFVAANGEIRGRFTHFTPPDTTKYCSIAFRGLKPQHKLYAPENVINGISRPVALPNMWRAPVASEPYLELRFERPVDTEEIQLIVNPMLQHDHFSDPIEALIKSYSLEVEHRDGTYRYDNTSNYLSLLRHPAVLKGVKQIRFTFRETYGLPYAEVFAVKVF